MSVLLLRLTSQHHSEDTKEFFIVSVRSYVAETHGYQSGKSEVQRCTVAGLVHILCERAMLYQF